jgi:hypothetical protein
VNGLGVASPAPSAQRRRSAIAPLVLAMVAGMAGTAAQSASAAVVNRDINSYVLFAYNELVFKGGSAATNSGFITGGNIGVNYAGLSQSAFSLEFATSARARMDDGFQAVADSVRGDAAGSFFDLFANSVNPSFASQIRGSGPTAYSGPIVPTPSLPTLGFTPNRALTNSAADLTVNGSGGLPSPQTITPGAYRDVRFNDNSVVTFGAGVFDLRNLSIGKNVTINVSDSTVLQIDRQFDPNDFLIFGANPGSTGLAKILVGGFGDNPTTTRSTNFSHNAEIHAQYFAPNSWLDLGGGNELYGRYWALRITGDPNNNVHFVPAPGALVGVLMMGAAGAVGRRRRRRPATA